MYDVFFCFLENQKALTGLPDRACKRTSYSYFGNPAVIVMVSP